MKVEIKQNILLYIGSLILSLGIMVMSIFMFETLVLNLTVGLSLCGIGGFISSKTVTSVILKAMKEKGKSNEKK
ncbi:hypothetical protein [Lactococcus ileimucosae]|uniref:hypothetical protein n=1 Tax=Lactococcus ileimucosae TaxID=2941329 RepID=UPI00204466F5|nr:hypothetical protein [Lactococcus ileimucosae]